MSTIDKASLIQIPSGYKSTKLYSIKPSNGDGDFTFSRSSSATRVNSEGLIEVASVLGSEEVINGDFATDSDWAIESTWTISGGAANGNGASGSTQELKQTSVNTIGKTYKATFEVLNYVSGTVGFWQGSGISVIPRSANGTYTEYFTATSTEIRFRPDAFIGSIDNVSVKEVIENDVPRLDYSGGASCASLLLEPQRTNLITYSEDLDSNTKLNVVVTSNDTISPDGTQNADKLETTSNNSFKLLKTNSISFVSGTDYTFSFYAKKGTTDFIQLITTNTLFGATSEWANFDLNNGIVSLDNYGGASIEDIGDGWYRCKMTSTCVSSGTDGWFVSVVTSGTSTRAEYTTSVVDVYVWGLQVEEGSFPTSYIPSNSGSQTTRTADVCNNAGTSATFNSTEGVLFAEIAALADDSTQRFISLGDGTSNNRIILGYNNASNGIIFFIRVGGTLVANILTTINDIKNYNKLAVKWKENDFALWGNGVELGSDLSGVSFASGVLDNLNFLDADGTTEPFYGKTKQLMVFDEALSDEELSDLTGQVNLSFNNLATFYNYTIL